MSAKIVTHRTIPANANTAARMIANATPAATEMSTWAKNAMIQKIPAAIRIAL